MNCLEEKRIHCPYCGEPFDTTVDCSVDRQSYVEDCQVCCQPIVFDVWIGDTVDVDVRREND